ncbi:zinc-type alcohol dehydrogenase-like protein [Penicillium cataractarum]|uniref:Zinc-type alcohol dehydrogenase-like protein n=1 Tax=Penicillium cataractarum TaxID=2100454 RepID=A0A9W9SR87_9EURO|nr:zinc-type alcohol dehydrogenase-like protein [Penicillium cataractarum]KAJ5381028.1 zinc-type alcohol dehydrogenase-like protein [Penicillium cataractarum]
MENLAAWIKFPKTDVVLETTLKYTPGIGQVLVKVESIGFNPVEPKIQKWSALPFKYPGILGISFAGTVEQVGPSVTSVKVGDHVVVSKSNEDGDDASFSAYQKFALARVSRLAKLDQNVSLDAAAVSITNSATVVAALSAKLGLRRPPVTGKLEPNGKKVLIYGGSSNCGGHAVKYASDAGYEVITTSSPGRKDIVQQLGPAQIIDHTIPKEQLIERLRSHGPYDAVFDAIGLPAATEILVAMFGDETVSYHSTLPPMGPVRVPSNITINFASYPSLLDQPENEEIRSWFFETYFPQGLCNGQILPGAIMKKDRGLNSIQGILDILLENPTKRFVCNPQDTE